MVFLHGWGDTAKTFSSLIEQLQDKYQILTLDLPGFGGTQPPPSAWGTQDYSLFVKSWLKKIGISKIHGVIGHSYGGAITVTALASGDIKADKLILLASAGIRNKRSLRKKTLKAAAKTAKMPLKLLPNYRQNQIKRRLYTAAGSDISLLPHMELTFKRIIGEDVQELAARLKIQTLIIYGDKDKTTPLQDGRKLNNLISGSYLEVIDAGHFLHQEQAEEVGRLIFRFLEGK